MKANRSQIEKGLDAPPLDIRLFLLYGPDEAGSAALARRMERAMGEGAERIDLEPAVLKTDPARLTDEAAALSMFGDRRWIRIMGAGEESVAAIEALLQAPQAGNPVVMIAGGIRNTSKLAKLCLDAPAVLAFASYAPDEREAVQIAQAQARELGLRLSTDLARRIADLTGNDRALMAGEVEKLALYLDAAPDHPVEATAAALDALSAETVESDVTPLVNAVLGGDVAALHHELAMAQASATPLASVTRPLLNRALLIAQIQSAFERSGSMDKAMESEGKAIFWKEKATVQRQARAWPGATMEKLIHRLLEAERMTRTSLGPGDVAVRQELLTITRQAERNR
ncbi:MAG: DNA polymerase III subunit delta [Sphingobium sp.]|nr:DNA polymerase III subunit delta [Sphingobium sp.]MCI1272779.1 DNA polymerase III subunit delta [Sphingobium sp.]MCI1755463.1 DNA polymerase III subunit delta [Sphingobium sp.]MCI2052164.1 DNA polymerase III subunit delta [Sphingobium sp.]